MDVQFVINIVLVISGFAGSLFVKDLVDKVKTLEMDHKEMPDRYVRRDDFKSTLERIESMLGKIFDKLETKADKE
jgi:hypothetical protein